MMPEWQRPLPVLTIDELDAAIYALNFTFGDNALKPHGSPHNTRVEAVRKLAAIRASITVAVVPQP